MKRIIRAIKKIGNTILDIAAAVIQPGVSK